MEKLISVAIDGLSGAGKSTIARAAAQRFGFIYVDTGAIYRTVAYAVFLAGKSCSDAAAVCAQLPAISISMAYDSSGVQRMYLDGEDVSDTIRTPENSIRTSQVSAIPEVRAFLMDMQRDQAKRHNVVMDGRDIGTVVLPDATLKIFLTASAITKAFHGEGWHNEEACGVILNLNAQEKKTLTEVLSPQEHTQIIQSLTAKLAGDVPHQEQSQTGPSMEMSS